MTSLSERATSVSRVCEWAERGRLFAIVDATDTPAVPERASRLGEGRAVSLYRGDAEESLSAIAPYLIHLDWPTLEWIIETLWPTPWGVLVLADTPLDALRTHFRKFLVVDGPAGESWYFRFYDPRVLPAYLASCDDEQLRAFFGPVLAYGLTDHETYGVKVLSRGTERVPVRPVPPPNLVIQL